jgi:hypothetical protein
MAEIVPKQHKTPINQSTSTCSQSSGYKSLLYTHSCDHHISHLIRRQGCMAQRLLACLYVPLKNFSLIWRRHHCRWRAAKFRSMVDAQGLWEGRDFYRATTAVTRNLSFSGLIRRIAQFSRLLRHTKGCGGSILTRILTGHMTCWWHDKW